MGLLQVVWEKSILRVQGRAAMRPKWEWPIAMALVLLAWFIFIALVITNPKLPGG